MLDMNALKKSEARLWPQIAPTLKLDLVVTPIDEGPWAMALSPMEFAKKHKILEEEKGQVTRAHARLYGDITVNLIKDKATVLLKKQIGPRWEGIDHSPIHVQALYAIFAARSHQDRKGAMEITKRIAASSETGKLDFTGVKELLAKHQGKRDVQQICSRHAYLMTVMASMLEFARLDGVLASADFLWLKPVDRPLWYMLNCVGRQTPYVEVAGPFAHWLVEKSLNRRVTRPTVDQAVIALEIALKDTIYVPDDFSGEKKT
jgi:intracellular multiplication protein IcmP